MPALLPGHGLAFQVGEVTLAAAQAPAVLVKQLPLRIDLGGGDDRLVFHSGEGELPLVMQTRALQWS